MLNEHATLVFLRQLLDPEMYGYAVTAEVRDCARELLGLPRVETVTDEDKARAIGQAAWEKTHGLSPGGVNPNWAPSVKEWK